MAGRAAYALLALVVVVVGVLAGSAVGGGPSETQAGPLTVPSIKSVFDAAQLATVYSSDIGDVSGKKTYVAWSLDLKLVDPAGSSPPGNPNSHAAVDGACNNSKLPGGEPTPLAPDHTVWKDIGNTFTWYHGDKGAYAPSTYGCDHTKMGPSGHQGVVTLTVISADKKWDCEASIAGSNLSPDPVYSAKPKCVNVVRERLSYFAGILQEDMAKEDAAAELVDGFSAKANDALDTVSHRIGSIASDLKRSGGAADAASDLRQASKLDGEAGKEDVLTNDGQKKAKDDVAAAKALKQKALAELKKLVEAQPTH